MKIKISNHERITCSSAMMVVFLLGLVGQAELVAQQIIVQGRAVANRETTLHEQFTQQLNQKKEAAQNRIELRISDIENACQLTDGQRKKLTIAGKGAVKSYMDKEIEQVKKTAQQVGFDFEPGNPPEAVADGDEAKKPARGQNVFFFNGAGRNDANNNGVEQQKIWESSVQKVLSEEQTKKLDSWTTQRESLRQMAAVDTFIARVDSKLLLSPAQREKLKSWVSKNHGKKLAARLDPQRSNQPFVVLNDATDEKTAGAESLPAEILSETQQQGWKSNFKNELSGVTGGPNRFAMPAVRLLPAVKVVEEIEDDN